MLLIVLESGDGFKIHIECEQCIALKDLLTVRSTGLQLQLVSTLLKSFSCSFYP